MNNSLLLWAALLLAVGFTTPYCFAQADASTEPPAASEAKDEEHEDHDDDDITVTPDEVKGFLEDMFPSVAKDLPEIAKEDPEHHRDILEHFEFIFIEYLYLQRDEPEMAKTFLKMEQSEIQTHVLAEAYHEAEGEDRKQAAEAFQEHLEKLFDLRIVWERRELNELRRQVEDLEDMIEEMEDHRGKEIEHMLNEWLGIGEEEDDEE